MKKIRNAIGLGLAALLVAAPAHAQKRKDKSVYSAPDSSGQVRGVGVESQDIVSMSDQMVRDLLTLPALMNATTPPRVIIDSKGLRNESSEIIDKAMITDRIRVHLNRAAQGRIRFIGQEHADLVQLQRDLKDSGRTDVGTKGRTRAMGGVDYQLVGRISTRDSVDPRTGMRSRYSMYTFDLLDVEYGDLVWSNLYEFKKETADNVVYR